MASQQKKTANSAIIVTTIFDRRELLETNVAAPY